MAITDDHEDTEHPLVTRVEATEDGALKLPDRLVDKYGTEFTLVEDEKHGVICLAGED